MNREAVLTDFDRVLWLVVEKFEASQECSGNIFPRPINKTLRVGGANLQSEVPRYCRDIFYVD